MEHIRTYMDIQQMRFLISSKWYDIDESVMVYKY